MTSGISSLNGSAKSRLGGQNAPRPYPPMGAPSLFPLPKVRRQSTPLIPSDFKPSGIHLPPHPSTSFLGRRKGGDSIRPDRPLVLLRSCAFQAFSKAFPRHFSRSAIDFWFQYFSHLLHDTLVAPRSTVWSRTRDTLVAPIDANLLLLISLGRLPVSTCVQRL